MYLKTETAKCSRGKHRSALSFSPLKVLLILSLVIVIQRIHTYHEPPERDLALYAVIGHELLAGRYLYSDLWDHKPPGIYVTCAIAEAIAGYGPAAIFLLNVSTTIATLFGVYAAGRAISKKPGAGLWAAAFWTAVSRTLTIDANQPNVEAFINPCLIWAFAIFVRMEGDRCNIGRLLTIGLLFSLSSFYKHNTIVVAALLTCAYIAFPPSNVSNRRYVYRQAGFIIGFIVVMWAILFGYFALTDRLREFYDSVFVYNNFYSRNIFSNLIRSLHPSKFITHHMKYSIPLLCLAGTWGVIGALYRSLRRPWILYIAFTIGVHVMVASPGPFFPHYYQLYLPPLMVGAGLTLGWLWQLKNRHIAWLSIVLGSAVLIVLLYPDLALFRLSADEISEKKAGDAFFPLKKYGLEISSILKPDETFYVWGADSGLYYYSRCRPPTGVLFMYHLGHSPLYTTLNSRVVADLEREQPELFILNKAYRFEGPVSNWFSNKYTLFPGNPNRGTFILFVRRGGKLEARLNSSKTNSVQ